MLVQLFLNGAGRIGRGAFLAAAAVLLGALALFDAEAPSAVHRWLVAPVRLALLFSACAVIGKRLHDRGRSGWWSALVLLAFVNVWPAPQGLGWLFLPVLALAVIELGVAPGQARFNRFGPRPAAPWSRSRAPATVPAGR
jgi:uncharacterized membrane protein YhaH (DUF805 family)